jgi:hypothetical protein
VKNLCYVSIDCVLEVCVCHVSVDCACEESLLCFHSVTVQNPLHSCMGVRVPVVFSEECWFIGETDFSML